MNVSFTVFGIKTGIISPGDSIVGSLLQSLEGSLAQHLVEGEIVVRAESALATTEGRIVALSTFHPSDNTKELEKNLPDGPPCRGDRASRERRSSRRDPRFSFLHEERHPPPVSELTEDERQGTVAGGI